MNLIQAALPLAGAAAIVAVAGCTGTSGATPQAAHSVGASVGASARAVASALKNSPQYQKDKKALIARIDTCWHAHAVSLHPYKGTLHCVFPKGDTAAIEAHARQTFTLQVVSSPTTRHAWEQSLAAYALAHGQK